MCSGLANLESLMKQSPLMIVFSREVTSACVMVSGRRPATSEHCNLPHENMCPTTQM